ncbi:MAG TPA: hypothetical protein VN920_14405, partial [Pyrinomonadaceae bacterium]|nr:hypothetical protein [Pyrinomonadaceae bacterium]
RSREEFKALSQFLVARPMMHAISRMVARFEISEPASRSTRNEFPMAVSAMLIIMQVTRKA